MKFPLVFWTILLAVASANAMTLKEAVGLALQQSNQIKINELNLTKSELFVTRARSEFLPQVGLTGSSTMNYLSAQTPNTFNQQTGSIYISENLYDHGLSYYGYRSSDLQFQLAKLEYQREKSKIIYDIVSLYLEALRKEKVLALQSLSAKQVEKVYNLVTSQYRQGVRQRSDFLRFESQYQRSILAESAARMDLVKARKDFKVYLALPDDSFALSEPSNLNPPIPSAGVLYETQKKDLSLQIKETDEKISRADYWPQLDVYGKLSYGSNSYTSSTVSVAGNNQTSGIVGVTLNWNIWDWGKRKAAWDSAHLETLKVQNQTVYEERDALQEIQVLEEQVAFNRRQLEIAEKLFKVEQENYHATERDLRSGQTTFLTYATSLSDFLSVQTQKLQSEYSLLLSQLQLGHRKGFLNENIFE